MEVFIDSSTIIYGLEIEKSNSALILDLIVEGEIKGVISEKVVEEVRNYFKRRRGAEYSFLVVSLLLKNFKIIYRHEIEDKIREWKGKIKEKDLEHLATVKMLKLKYLVAYDRDFERFKEYSTPRQFLEKIRVKAKISEY